MARNLRYFHTQNRNLLNDHLLTCIGRNIRQVGKDHKEPIVFKKDATFYSGVLAEAKCYVFSSSLRLVSFLT